MPNTPKRRAARPAAKKAARKKPAESLAELVTRCREESGLSLREVSAASNGLISHQMVANIERGDRKLVDPDKYRALAQALGNTTYEELMAAAGYARPPGRARSLRFSVLLADHPELKERDIEEIEAFAEFIIDKRRKAARARG